jgi:iron complex transport system substrate-binding protein
VQADVLAKLEALGATVLAIDPQTVDGVLEAIEKVGLATGQKAEAKALTAKMRADIAMVESSAKGAEPVTVFMEIGQNPLFAVGSQTLLDDLITRAGGRNVVTKPGYVAYSNEQVLKDDPQVYLATKGSMSNPDDLKKGPLGKLTAVQQGRVFSLDENLVTRPGPRIAEGLKDVALALQQPAK